MTKGRNVSGRTAKKYGLDTRNENYYLSDPFERQFVYSTKKDNNMKKTLASLASSPLVPLVITAGAGIAKFIYNKIKSRKKKNETPAPQISPNVQPAQPYKRSKDEIYGGFASPVMSR